MGITTLLRAGADLGRGLSVLAAAPEVSRLEASGNRGAGPRSVKVGGKEVEHCVIPVV